MISILVDNFNRAYLIPLLIKSYDNEQYKDAEMIIVDDASDPTDRLKEYLSYAFEHIKPCFRVKAFRMPVSTHFNGGRTFNVAAKQSQGNIVVFSPPDMIPLTPVLASIQKHHSETDWLYLAPKVIRSNNLGQVGEGLIGGASVPKKMFDELGGFDERFIGYGNVDVDFMYRIRHYSQAPWKLEAPGKATLLPSKNWKYSFDPTLMYLHLEQTKIALRVDNLELRNAVTMDNWKERRISVNPNGYGVCNELEKVIEY